MWSVIETGHGVWWPDHSQESGADGRLVRLLNLEADQRTADFPICELLF